MVDHDRLFKELLRTFFLEFIDLFFPEVGNDLDRQSLVFLDKEVFTDVTEGEKREVDLVVRARFREQESFFLIHVENQASAKAGFHKRMFRYFARLNELHDLPIYPIALLSFDEPFRLEPNNYKVEFSGFVVLDFHFKVIQLNRLNWRDFLRQPNPVASALISKMKMTPEERPRVKLECLRLLATLRLDPARMQLISGFVDTYLRLNAQEQAVFQEELATIRPAERERVVQIVTSWMEEGLQQGRQEGAKSEALTYTLRLLIHRLGNIPPETQARVSQLAVSELENLGIAALDFSSPMDLIRWLDNLPSN
jgi:Domain of unknown function (DUF4351)